MRRGAGRGGRLSSPLLPLHGPELQERPRVGPCPPPPPRPRAGSGAADVRGGRRRCPPAGAEPSPAPSPARSTCGRQLPPSSPGRRPGAPLAPAGPLLHPGGSLHGPARPQEPLGRARGCPEHRSALHTERHWPQAPIPERRPRRSPRVPTAVPPALPWRLRGDAEAFSNSSRRDFPRKELGQGKGRIYSRSNDALCLSGLPQGRPPSPPRRPVHNRESNENGNKKKPRACLREPGGSC